MPILVNCAHFSKNAEVISLVPRALFPGDEVAKLCFHFAKL